MSGPPSLPPGGPKDLSPLHTFVASFSRHEPSVQTNDAEGGGSYDSGVYVLHVASSSSYGGGGGTVTCALSDRSVRIYDSETRTLVREYADAHGGAISDLCYLRPPGDVGGEGERLVCTSGRDGTVRIFDARVGPSRGTGAILECRLPKAEEATSHSVGFHGSLVAAGGSRGLIHFFDIRSTGGGNGGERVPLGTYRDAHTDEVTRVRFRPSPSSSDPILITASEDGLLNAFDTSRPSEELALKSVMNVGCPLRDVTFFGPNLEGALVLTGSESASAWHWDSAQRICDYGGDDFRGRLSAAAGAGEGGGGPPSSGWDMEYLAGAHWDDVGQELILLAGNSGGGGGEVPAGREWRGMHTPPLGGSQGVHQGVRDAGPRE